MPRVVGLGGAIHGTSPTDVWVAGERMIRHWDGSTWTTGWTPPSTQSPQPEIWLDGVWALAPDDAWSVGSFGTVLRWDGTRWTALATDAIVPRVSSTYGDVGVELMAVWGRRSDDVWIVGAHATVLHWDGSALALVEEAQRLAGGAASSAAMRCVWGTADGELWIGGDADSQLLHFDGTAWSTVRLPMTTARATALWGSGPGDVWVAGLSSGLAHWNGNAWTAVRGAFDETFAITGTAADDVWVAGSCGEDFVDCGPVAHFDGTRWTRQSIGPYGRANAMWTATRGESWAFAAYATVSHRGSGRPMP